MWLMGSFKSNRYWTHTVSDILLYKRIVLTTGCQDVSSWSLCSATSEKPNSAGKPAKTIMLLNCQTTFPSSLSSTFSSSLCAISPTWGFNCRSYWSDVTDVILWSFMLVCNRQAQQFACHWKALYFPVVKGNHPEKCTLCFIWVTCFLRRYNENCYLFILFL